MVEAELKIRQPQTDSLGKQMRDPATAFPPLERKIYSLFGLVPNTHAPTETNGIKHCQYCVLAVAKFTTHRIFIYL